MKLIKSVSAFLLCLCSNGVLASMEEQYQGACNLLHRSEMSRDTCYFSLSPEQPMVSWKGIVGGEHTSVIKALLFRDYCYWLELKSDDEGFYQLLNKENIRLQMLQKTDKLVRYSLTALDDETMMTLALSAHPFARYQFSLGMFDDPLSCTRQ